jgi:hypothetical protein
MVAYALRFYALGLVAHATVEITVRAFYALHDTLTPVAVGIGAMFLNILLSVWWVRYWSFGGLALANSVATSLEMGLMLALLSRKMNGIEIRRLGTGGASQRQSRPAHGRRRLAVATLDAGAGMWRIRRSASCGWRPSVGSGSGSRCLSSGRAALPEQRTEAGTGAADTAN